MEETNFILKGNFSCLSFFVQEKKDENHLETTKQRTKPLNS